MGWIMLNKETPGILFSEWAKGPCFNGECKKPLSQFAEVWQYVFESDLDQALVKEHEEFLDQYHPDYVLLFCPDCKRQDHGIRHYLKNADQERIRGPIVKREFEEM